jgi:hypothetical protein
MNHDTHAQRKQMDEALHAPFNDASIHRPVRIHESYVIRSIRNITSWRAYLPESCVTAMIRMGWDCIT